MRRSAATTHKPNSQAQLIGPTGDCTPAGHSVDSSRDHELSSISIFRTVGTALVRPGRAGKPGQIGKNATTQSHHRNHDLPICAVKFSAIAEDLDLAHLHIRLVGDYGKAAQ